MNPNERLFKVTLACSTLTSSESLSIPTDTTPQGKLLPCRGVFDVQWTLSPFQGAGTRAHGTLGELRLDHACQTLEVIVARGTKVCGTETVVDSD